LRIFVITKKTLLFSAAALLLLILGLLFWICFLDGNAAVAASSGSLLSEQYEANALTAGKKELPVYSVAREDKKIALTIDAAWEDDKTQFILDTLKAHNVKATFFLCGFWVEKYPDMVRAIRDGGHVIGNHSDTHPHMNSLSEKEILKEAEAFEKRLEAITGERTKIFRVPYGEYNDQVIRTLRQAGYEVIQWNIETMDRFGSPVFHFLCFHIIKNRGNKPRFF